MANPSAHTSRVPVSAFDFLRALQQHNDRDWFQANKAAFLQAQEQLAAFANDVLQRLRTHDVIETPDGKSSLQRIYRDTRFSTDKTPYKTCWSGGFRREGKMRRGGYYFHLEPGNSFIGGGFWAPNAPDLKRVRDDIAFDPAPLQQILASPSFRSTFGSLEGEQLKTAPKGFDAQHPAIGLLRYKQFLVRRRFTDTAVHSSTFAAAVDDTFRRMRPFFDYMSDVLTTDVNGSAA